MNKLVVDWQGKGDYTTVQEAVNAVPDYSSERTVIYIKEGRYFEKLVVPQTKTNVSFIGESKEGTVLTYDDYASKRMPDGEKMGTYRTPSTTIYASDFYAENLTFLNEAGGGQDIGQAVALQVDGDRAVLHNVIVRGRQDTLFTTGKSRQYYAQCRIEGTVDFIFGPATAVFDQCELFSLDRHNGYVTAASTPEDQKYGYVFLNCRLTTNGPDEKVYLGRPWEPHGSVIYVNTWMDKHIRPVGWDNWRDPDRERTSRFYEIDCTGPGSSREGRVPWVKQMSEEQKQELTVTGILGGQDAWEPTAVIEQMEAAVAELS